MNLSVNSNFYVYSNLTHKTSFTVANSMNIRSKLSINYNTIFYKILNDIITRKCFKGTHYIDYILSRIMFLNYNLLKLLILIYIYI